MSEEIEEIHEVKKEGDDGYRWKVMARLETATHTHAHSLTHAREKQQA